MENKKQQKEKKSQCLHSKRSKDEVKIKVYYLSEIITVNIH